MAVPGRIQQRLALAIVLTALIPLLVAIVLAETAIRQASARFFVPEVGLRLDQSLGLYQELARAVKASMRHAATAIAARESLQAAVAREDLAATRSELERAFRDYPELVSLAVHDADDEELAAVRREKPLDPERENQLRVMRPLASGADDETEANRGAIDPGTGDRDVSQGAEAAPPRPADGAEEELAPRGYRLTAVFAADKARFDELAEMSQFVDTYRQIEGRREADQESYVVSFAVLLGITILAAIGVGTLLARSVSARVADLAEATLRVRAGDLSIRVSERGGDELADLARAFNRMLGEVESSRARIEYLQRIGAWQEMARRLAHEIKNPLTPIQLAVQEMHRRYAGGDAGYKQLVDTTLEVVEDEVGTLRRLVSEFSGFARLPQAELRPGDLAAFLREQSEQLELTDEERSLGEAPLAANEPPQGVRRLELSLLEGEAPANMDRQMLRRVLINLVRNAEQAIGPERAGSGSIRLTLTREADLWVLDVDDNGPGIPVAERPNVFDPYVTTRTEGTGLGLAIVKKIIVEHGGTVSALQSPLGGARIRLTIPVLGSAAADATFADHEPRAEV